MKESRLMTGNVTALRLALWTIPPLIAGGAGAILGATTVDRLLRRRRR